MKQSDSIGSLAAALARAQGTMKLAAKDATNPHLRNKYADLTAVWEACRDALKENEISISQLPSSRYEEGQLLLVLTTILMHSSGEWISDDMAAFVVGNKGVNDLQAMGSTITYMRRYMLSAFVGVATGDDDDGDSGQVTRQAPQRQQQPPASNGRKPEYARDTEVLVTGRTDQKGGVVVEDIGGEQVKVRVDGKEFWIDRTKVEAIPLSAAQPEPLFDDAQSLNNYDAEHEQ